MKKIFKIACLPIIIPLIASNTTAQNSIITSEEIKNFDQNSIIKNSKMIGGDFNNYLDSSIFPSGGNKYSGYYRGITSVNNGESDFYGFYDPLEDNTFIRMANFNGEDTSISTRGSFYYYNNEKDEPENIGSVSQINIKFNYRFVCDDNYIDDNKLILRFQSRGSAESKSGDIFARDLVINSIDDKYWQYYELTITCSESMTTEYLWLFFFYEGISKNMSPSYHMDIDNLFISINEKNMVYKNGEFEELKPQTIGLPTSPKLNSLYPTLFYNPDNGIYPTIGHSNNKNYLNLSSYKGKTTFSVYINEEILTKYLRISFDYIELSYYEKSNLVINLNGNIKHKLTTEDILTNEPYKSSICSSYSSLLENDWHRLILYIDLTDFIDLNNIEFILPTDSNLGIDNLSVDLLDSINLVSGNYQEFCNSRDIILDSLGDYKNKYTKEAINEIENSIDMINKINQYSSQELMNQAIDSLTNSFNEAKEIGDHEKLKNLMEEVIDTLVALDTQSINKYEYLKLIDALNNAYLLDENSSKEEIDKAYNDLLSAFKEINKIEVEL